MLFCKNVPTVIEPGVNALEVGLVRTYGSRDELGKRQARTFYVAFERVVVNMSNAGELPLVATSQHPHIFSMVPELSDNLFLLVYDQYGRLSIIYTRETPTGAWTRNDAASEQVGETVTRFSARFSFATISIRDKFVTGITKLIAGKYSKSDVDGIVRLLREAKEGIVVLPIAVAVSPPTKPVELHYGAVNED